jgi:hypothetical protein
MCTVRILYFEFDCMSYNGLVKSSINEMKTASHQIIAKNIAYTVTGSVK